MGFLGFSKGNKDAERENESAITIEPETDKEEQMPAYHANTKKKYLYIALNEEGKVILDKVGEPFFKVVEEGNSPYWSDSIYNYVKKVIVDKELREEIEDVPANLPKKDRKEVKRTIRVNAEKKLMEKAKATGKMEAAKQESSQPAKAAGEEDFAPAPAPEPTPESEAKPAAPVREQKQSEQSIKETEVILEAIQTTGDQLNRDFTNGFDDLSEISDKNTQKVKSHVDFQGKRIIDSFTRCVNDTAQMVLQKIQKYAENIISRVNETGRGINETQEKLVSKVKVVSKRMDEIEESVGGIEGNLHRLEQLDTITELLSNTGLTMSLEIPPVNADEEDIINLVRYSQKITEQLGYAARDLLRKQEAFRSREASNENEQKMMEQKLEKERKEGIAEGQREFVEKLIAKYEDVDTIRESENSHVHVIWTLLMELGVSIDGEGCYEKGKEIEFTDAEIKNMIGKYAKLDGAGTYQVVKTGLCFQGKILSKAVFEMVR